MKKIILLIFIIFYSNLFSQTEENKFVLNEKIKITSINLSVRNSLIHFKKKVVDENGKIHFENTPTSVTLDRINDNESYYYFHYNYIECDTIYVPLKNRIKFETKLFDNLVEKINTINIQKIKESDGIVLDGSCYNLSFSNNIYEISLYIYNPDIETKERNLIEFLETCKEISKITKYFLF
jgi:hypothetical protein